MEWDGAPVSAELELIWLEVVDLEYVEGVPIGLLRLRRSNLLGGGRRRMVISVVVSADKAILGSMSTSINA